MIPTLFFVLALLLLMYKFSFVASLVGAYLVWITGVLVLNQWYGELIGAFPPLRALVKARQAAGQL
jgi:hypothetical protein